MYENNEISVMKRQNGEAAMKNIGNGVALKISGDCRRNVEESGG
jgi:hypothetical protein